MVVVLTGCGSAYRSLQPAGGDRFCITAFRPVFQSQLYKTRVEIAGRELGGLLLVKTMEDSTRRVVFSTETGVKFFDFEFGTGDGFRTYFIMKRLNKKPVIEALRNDFSLVLMAGVEKGADLLMTREGLWYHGFRKGKKTAWYITDARCSEWRRAELGSRRKRLVEAEVFSGSGGVPDSVSIRHYNFNFNISLKKLDR